MNILDVLLQSSKDGPVDALSSMAGLQSNQMQQLLGQVLPVIAGGLRNEADSQSGLEGLMRALNSGNHDRYYDQVDTLGSPATRQDGNGILGHILGNKDASRNFAKHASTNTGINSALIKKMLPIIATVVMGALNKRATSQGMLGQQQTKYANNSGVMDMLSGFWMLVVTALLSMTS